MVTVGSVVSRLRASGSDKYRSYQVPGQNGLSLRVWSVRLELYKKKCVSKVHN
jgi:hypothetical protein